MHGFIILITVLPALLLQDPITNTVTLFRLFRCLYCMKYYMYFINWLSNFILN